MAEIERGGHGRGEGILEDDVCDGKYFRQKYLFQDLAGLRFRFFAALQIGDS